MKHSEFRYQSGLWLFAVLLAFQLGCASTSPQEQAREVLREAADAMGGLEALGAIQNISREGQSQRASLGQGPISTDRPQLGRPGPFKQLIDFTVPREVGLSGSREIPTVADWERGGYRNVFGMALRPLEPHQLTGYKTEWDRDIVKFLVHALGEESTILGISEVQLEGQPQDVVSVEYPGGTVYQVSVDRESHLITLLDFTEDRSPYGDVHKERTFSDYREVGNVKVPFKETTTEMGVVTQVREWSVITINGELPEEKFEIPEGLQELSKEIGHADTIEVLPSELADGVYFGESMHMNNMWVEFEDFIVVVEGPGNEMQSLDVFTIE